MNRAKSRATAILLVLAGIGIGVGISNRQSPPITAQEPSEKPSTTGPKHDHLMADTQAAFAPDWDKPYPQYQPVGRELTQFPRLKPGEMPPQELYRYGGRGHTGFASVDDVENFGEFCRKCSDLKPKVMAERLKYT